MKDVVGQVRPKLRVRQQGNSFVVSVSATAESPITSAALVNAMMDEYIKFLSDKRFEGARRFTAWLEGRVEELAQKLEVSEKEALAFRAVIEADADSSERLEQQMRELTTKLVNARAALAEADARARKVQEINDTDGPLAAADVLSTPTLLGYRGELADLRAEVGLGHDLLWQ